jgi:DNA-binding CsgD family transcriptional regulator
VPHPSPLASGPVPPAFAAAPVEVQALQALAADRCAEAAEGFARAAEAWAPHHLRGALRCHWAEGEAHRRAGDLARARDVLTALDARAGELGLLPLVARTRVSLRRAGLHLRQSSPTAAGGLTAREREVLELVGQGLSATAIGQHLGVAPSTVETQIAAGMRKLGARTRVQAAAILRSGATP